MEKYISFLSELSLNDVAAVGGKAANLGELFSAGFRAPEGFCVRITAFDDFLDRNNLNKVIDDIACKIDYTQISDVEKKTKEIRDIIIRALIPQDIQDEISSAYEKIARNGVLVAVRSSVGTRDLSRSSFPGQMDTYHNIRGRKEVISRIKECWASMWSSRAASTMHAKRIDHRMIIIAPIVQVMIPSYTAGVAFTANPLTGCRDEIMIDAAYGIGEAVVAGNMTPDNYILCKNTGNILNKTIGYKRFKVELDRDKGSGNVRRELSEQEARCECLQDSQIKEIGDAAAAIEKHYKYPLDIEWAYAGGILYILQARRITALNDSSKQAPPARPVNVWSRKFGDEYLAEYALPLNYDLLVRWIIDVAMKGMVKILGRKDMADIEPVRNYNGYAYMSGEWVACMVKSVPKKFRKSDIIDWFPGFWHDEIVSRPFEPRWVPGSMLYPLRDRRASIRKNDKALHQHCLNIEKTIIPKLGQDYRALSVQEWKKQFDEADEFGREHFRVIRWGLSMHNPTLHGILEKLMELWVKDDGSLYQKIISGIPGTKTAELNRDIWLLGRDARTDKILTDLLLKNNLSYAEVRNRIPDAGFWTEFDGFIKRHGHRAATRDISQPRWNETPDIILGFVRAQLRSQDPADPDMKARESSRQREQAEAEALKRAGGFIFAPVRRKILRRVFSLTQTYMRYRENQRYHLDYLLTHMRHLILEQGRRFADKKIIRDAGDIFFLNSDELWNLFGSMQVSDDILQKIEERRKHYLLWKDKIPATYLYDDTEVDDELSAFTDSGNSVKGMGASAGYIKGYARVAGDLSQLDQVKSGEILVACNIDPGWTNVFPLLGGLITETGGMLAHGALLAREYGIPAVMGVLNATKNFKTGELLELDGKKGIIRRLDNN